MITIEASNINVGGSLNLLIDFVGYVNDLKIPARVYVAYDEVFLQLSNKNLESVDIVKTDLFHTLLRYMETGRKNVLYFCSLPPFVRNMNSYVYFHTEYYANPLLKGYSLLSISEKIKKIVYYFILKFFHNNCNLFFCQTKGIKEKLCKTYGIHAEVMPFFNKINVANNGMESRKEFDFIFPALCSKHKNHMKLLEAIKLARKKCRFNVVLTISESAKEILNVIDGINQDYPLTIINIGVVPHSIIYDYYRRTKFLIFPSTMESLGLPLLEAVAHNEKVLVSDRDYAYSAIENPITFDPDRVESISLCICKAMNGDYDNIIQKIILKDSKQSIISCLTNYNDKDYTRHNSSNVT